MNRFQKQRSKEIKQLLKYHEFGFTTYSQARRYWNWLYRYTRSFSPCDRCFNDSCQHNTKPLIVYCPNAVTCDIKLARALKTLPQGIKMMNN